MANSQAIQGENLLPAGLRLKTDSLLSLLSAEF
jgi:hypothetical protein